METKANKTLIGVFVLIAIAALLVSLIWLSRYQGERIKKYEILFSGSISGLKEGSEVEYRGVPVGSVEAISIDKDNIENIRVRVSIKESIPIREGVIASIEMKGITGLANIQIKGGTNEGKELRAYKGKDYPLIPSIPSRLETIFESIPHILDRMTNITERLSHILNSDNQTRLENILGNMDNIMAQISNKAHHIGPTLVHLEEAIKLFGEASLQVRDLLTDNRAPLKNFTQVGLGQFIQLIGEVRSTIMTLNRIADKFERSPSRFLLEDTNYAN